MTSSIRRGQRRGISLTDPELVTRSFLPGRDSQLPVVFAPSRPGVDFVGWAGAHREQIEAELATFGAVLFRGFGIDSAAGFSAAAAAVVGQLFGDYGDLPREQDAEKVFASTPYPPELPIHFHNESSHMAQWPMNIFFHCAVAATTGGQTPVLDCRALYRELDAQIVAEFEQRGLVYIRNFGKGVDVAWQDFFATEDRSQVEQACADSGTVCEWLDDGTLRIRQAAAAVRVHPKSGEKSFFNQVLLHHPAALPAEIRSAMTEIYSANSFPRNVTYGDGSPIPDDVIEYLLAEYDRRAASYYWEAGDMIMLDNMLVSHGRSVFTGARKIHVAMANIEQSPASV